jgi:hypothetical protein
MFPGSFCSRAVFTGMASPKDSCVIKLVGNSAFGSTLISLSFPQLENREQMDSMVIKRIEVIIFIVIFG